MNTNANPRGRIIIGKHTVVMSHVLALALGVIGQLVFDKVRAQVAIPPVLAGTEDFRVTGLAATGRFVIVAAKPNPGIGDETVYDVWDRVAKESLVTFTELATDMPLISRRLYLPGDAPLRRSVAHVFLDRKDYHLCGISLSPACSSPRNEGGPEVIYDTNLDGILDKLITSTAAPYAALVRISATDWAKARDADDHHRIEALMGENWVRVKLQDSGFWGPDDTGLPATESGLTVPERRAVPGRVQNIDRPQVRSRVGVNEM